MAEHARQDFPTVELVEKREFQAACALVSFTTSPGCVAAESSRDAIGKRFKALRGMTPELSRRKGGMVLKWRAIRFTNHQI